MVNNSTSINNQNNRLSPKESLNSDGQQFYQYQQSEQSSQTFEDKKAIYEVGIQGPGIEQTQK